MDIRRKLAQMIAKKVIVMVMLALFLIVCTISVHDLTDYFYVIGSIVLSIVILIIYLRASDLWRIIRDKSWEGTVVNIRCEEAREPVTFAHAVDRTRRGIPKMIKYSIIEVKLNDGTNKKLKIPCRELDVNVFRVGDKIIHHKGMKYPLNPCRRNEIHMCPACGRFLNDNYCPDCKFNF